MFGNFLKHSRMHNIYENGKFRRISFDKKNSLIKRTAYEILFISTLTLRNGYVDGFVITHSIL